ncbi:type I secretion C-terminal target domain-containing protein, partial [Aquabacterium sp. A08]|uniref:type I secretion C-terminal target domain-containing protein n=1 Tax=Aquabacterium sp. A08 TaxID=2718532 RepID=UPI00141DFB85
GAGQTVTANVLTNDSYGADDTGGLKAFSWDANTAAKAVLATYGTLTLGTDGQYTFTLNNASAAVQALTASGTPIQQTLTYTITDADGDTSPGSVIIKIVGADDSASVTVATQGADSTVYEAGLTSVANTSETDSDSFQVNATDGIASVTIGTGSGAITLTLGQLTNLGGVAAVDKTYDTGEGTLVVTGFNSTDGKTGTVSYSYTLKAAQTHDKATADTAISDSVPVAVAGVGGTGASANLSISIVDDVPSVIVNDTWVYNTQNATNTGTDAIAFGADGPAATGSLTLSCSNLPTGYALIQSGNVWTAIKSGSPDLFSITLDPTSGQYSFQLLSAKPTQDVNVDVDQGLVAGSWYDASNQPTTDPNNVYSVVIEPAGGSPFRITASGVTNGAPSKLSVQNSTIGVGGDDTIQQTGGADDRFKLSFQNVTGQAATLTNLSLAIAQYNANNDEFVIRVTGVQTNGQVVTVEYSDASAGVVLSGGSGNNPLIVSVPISGFVSVSTIELDSLNSNIKVVDYDLAFKVQQTVGDYQYDFTAGVKDGDLDATSDTFSVKVLAGTAGDDTLVTGIFADTVSGGDGNDSISTGAANDILSGGAGNDTLIGGLGNDILEGGADADVFVWKLGDAGASGAKDVIRDFNVATDAPSKGGTGDVIDIRDLIDVSENIASLQPYLSFANVDNKLALVVDVDGSGTGTIKQTIVFDNVDVTAGNLQAAKDAFAAAMGLSGTGLTDNDLINRMITDGHLKTDL